MTQPSVNEVLNQLITAAHGTAAWVQGQLPDVIHQLMAYREFVDITVIIGCVLVIVAGAVATKMYWKKSEYPDPACMMFWLFGLGPVIGFFVAMFDLVEIIIAPKIWLLEYAAGLISGH